MNTAFLTVDSVTYAIKARKVLSAIGIHASVKKVNATATGRGCRYGIFIERRHLFSAMAELKQKNIAFEEWRGYGYDLP
ncbi:MAG: DUF3343 domain-containing protein [Clostridia bacterium]|nr:DUF3343 domain-containing protein [Clostridia bacterium]